MECGLVLPLAPSLERRRIQAYLGLLVADGCAILVAFSLIPWFYFGQWITYDSVQAAQLLIPAYWTAALVMQVYSRSALISASRARSRALQAMLSALTIIVVAAFITKSSATFSRFVVVSGAALATALILYSKRLLQPLVQSRCGANALNVLVIDDGGDPLEMADAFHVDARQHKLAPDLSDPHMLDRIGLYLMNMDRVLVSCPAERRGAWALVFKSANIEGEIVDRDVWELGILGARRDRDCATLVVSTGPLGLRSRALKRAFDFSTAAVAVALLSPLIALVAALILLEDGRPVFFVQPRTGRGNRFFSIYKFRSMRAVASDHQGDRSASRGDERVTRVGNLIRRTSVDELPQLFNVLLGDMSIVGPRPHAVGSRAGEKLFWEVDNRYWLRHSLKPGLTGLAQVRGLRGATVQESDLADRLQADLEYLDGWTIMRDLRIVLSTLRVLIHKQAF